MICGLRPGSCSWAEGWGGLDACRMGPRRKSTGCRSGPWETRHPACSPCFALSRFTRLHSVIRRGGSPRWRLGGLDGAIRGALVLPPGCVLPHQPTRCGAGDAAHAAHTHFGVHWCGSSLALFVHHSRSSDLSILCLDVTHHASSVRQRVHTVLTPLHHGACFRTTLLLRGGPAVFIRHFR